MADEKTTANKSDADKAAQNDPKNPASQQPAKIDHGQPPKAEQESRKEAEKQGQDPWGTTPAQMRDKHDELVDPAKNEPGDGINRGAGGVRVDPMEPQIDDAIADDHGISGGTNAPA